MFVFRVLGETDCVIYVKFALSGASVSSSSDSGSANSSSDSGSASGNSSDSGSASSSVHEIESNSGVDRQVGLEVTPAVSVQGKHLSCPN